MSVAQIVVCENVILRVRIIVLHARIIVFHWRSIVFHVRIIASSWADYHFFMGRIIGESLAMF